jgi:hypothetical protein
MWMVRRVAPAAVVIAALVACGGRDVATVPDDPVDTARALIRAAKDRRCAEAWTLVSTESRESMRERARLEIRRAPYYVESFSPEGLLCGHTILAESVPESARLDHVDSDRAVVAVNRLEGRNFLIPGFFPRSREAVPDRIALVHEAEHWRLDLVMTPPEDGRWREETVGDLPVRFQAYGRKTTVWVEGVVDAPVKGVQSVATDVSAWPRLFPWIGEARIVTVSGGEDTDVPWYARGVPDRYARLQIVSPAGTPMAAVVKMRSYADAASSCCFGVGGALLGDDQTPLGVEHLMLVAYPEGDGGTHLQLGYEIEPRRAPELAEQMLSADVVAGFFRAVERAARTR